MPIPTHRRGETMKHKLPIDAPAGALPLDEAIREFVPAELWAHYRKAAENCKGLPPEMWLPGDSENALEVNEQTKLTKKMRKERDAAWSRIATSFLKMLWEGSLIAYGRQGILDDLLPIPAHAWRYLLWRNFKTGTVTGGGEKFYDVHIAESGPLSPGPHASVDRSPRKVDARDAGADRGIVGSEQPREAVESRFPCNEPLQISVDRSSSTVAILGIGELTGKHFNLVLELFRNALGSYFERETLEHRAFILPCDLAQTLRVTEDTLRKRISNCRLKFSAMYQEICGRQPDEDMLIETEPGSGYRLNPRVRFVDPMAAR